MKQAIERLLQSISLCMRYRHMGGRPIRARIRSYIKAVRVLRDEERLTSDEELQCALHAAGAHDARAMEAEKRVAELEADTEHLAEQVTLSVADRLELRKRIRELEGELRVAQGFTGPSSFVLCSELTGRCHACESPIATVGGELPKDVADAMGELERITNREQSDD